jgi:hypothetical protein
MEYGEYEYLPEFVAEPHLQHSNYLNIKRKPQNSMDYEKFQTEEYLKYKLDAKIKEKLSELKLNDKYLSEIAELSIFYFKKFTKNKHFKSHKENKEGVCPNLKISELISIISYKVLKKYKIPISHHELCQKLKISISKFIKYSKLFEIHENQVSKEIKCSLQEKNFFDDTFLDETKNMKNDNEYQQTIISLFNLTLTKLENAYKSNPNILKTEKKNENLISNLFENYSAEINKICSSLNGEKNGCKISPNSFIDYSSIFENVKREAWEIINNVYFTINFKGRILNDSLVCGLIRLLFQNYSLKIKLSIFNDFLKVPRSGVSKATEMLNKYLKTKM